MHRVVSVGQILRAGFDALFRLPGARKLGTESSRFDASPNEDLESAAGH